jgi:hypothetical protein
LESAIIGCDIWFTRSLPLPRHASPASTSAVETARDMSTLRQMNLATHPRQPLRCDSTPRVLADVSGAAGGSPSDCSSGELRGRPCQPLRSCRRLSCPVIPAGDRRLRWTNLRCLRPLRPPLKCGKRSAWTLLPFQKKCLDAPYLFRLCWPISGRTAFRF